MIALAGGSAEHGTVAICAADVLSARWISSFNPWELPAASLLTGALGPVEREIWHGCAKKACDDREAVGPKSRS
ncbi:MAG: hypothetical protein ACLQIS_18030 [Bryobacteraceae bacterium]